MGTVTLRWVGGKLMVGSDSNKHSVVIGNSPEDDATFLGLKPSDLLLLAAASCSAYDVIEILKKQREPLQDLVVLCTGEQVADPPFKFTKIHIHYQVSGPVQPDSLEKAIRLSEDKYCSVIATLRPGVPVTSDYELMP